MTDPKSAQEMTYMLKGVVKEGTGVKAQINNWDIAGKTELPFTSDGGAKDHWFVGYTSQLVGAVWYRLEALSYWIERRNCDSYLQTNFISVKI